MGWADGSVDTISFVMVFVIDANHSNDKCVDFVRQVLGRVQRKEVRFNQQYGESFRIGIVVFRDEGEEFLCGPQCKLTSDFKKINVALSSIECAGAGDDQYAVTAGLELALSASSGWTENSSKHVILVGSSRNNSVSPSITTILERVGDVTEESMAKRARALITLHAVAMHAGKPNKQHLAEFRAIAVGEHSPGIVLQVNELSPKKFKENVDFLSENITQALDTLIKIRTQ